MNKDEILNMSRKENEGKESEWEQSVANRASNAATTAGLIISILLMLLDDLYLHSRVVGMVARIVFFTMEAASNTILFLNYRKKSKLIWAIVGIVCAIGDLAMLIILCGRLYG